MSDLPPPEKTATVIDIKARDPLFPDLAEAWHHRQLAFTLARRNVKVRYKQTVLGNLWIVLQPILLTGTLTLVLGMLLSVPSGGLPYALFAFSGASLWSAFQRTLTETSVSFTNSGNVISKVYFPRILIPVAALLTALVDLVPIYVLLLVAVFSYHLFPGWPIVVSPAIILVALLMAFAAGLWVTMLDAIYRDMRLVIPSILQLVFYVSPVMYSETIVPARWQTLYHLNPLVGLFEAFRWSLVAGAPAPSAGGVSWCIGVTLLLLVGGFSIFARLERFAVDRI